jgi:hypothetical protein
VFDRSALVAEHLIKIPFNANPGIFLAVWCEHHPVRQLAIELYTTVMRVAQCGERIVLE